MRERPIIFSAPMVRALLAGTKTQTRRILKIPGCDPGTSYAITSPEEEIIQFDDGSFHYLSTSAMSGPYPCPYGEPGDRLWVREKFKPVTSGQIKDGYGELRYGFAYEADGATIWRPRPTRIYDGTGRPDTGHLQFQPQPWKSPIHMPRRASRIRLEITSVRAQRLKDISEDDCRAEGCLGGHDSIPGYPYSATPREQFWQLWQSINAARRPKLPSNPNSRRYARVQAWLESHPDTSSWDANPWVWAITFTRVEPAHAD
jgi:hypothetical protein